MPMYVHVFFRAVYYCQRCSHSFLCDICDYLQHNKPNLVDHFRINCAPFAAQLYMASAARLHDRHSVQSDKILQRAVVEPNNCFDIVSEGSSSSSSSRSNNDGDLNGTCCKFLSTTLIVLCVFVCTYSPVASSFQRTLWLFKWIFVCLV